MGKKNRQGHDDGGPSRKETLIKIDYCLRRNQHPHDIVRGVELAMEVHGFPVYKEPAEAPIPNEENEELENEAPVHEAAGGHDHIWSQMAMHIHAVVEELFGTTDYVENLKGNWEQTLEVCLEDAHGSVARHLGVTWPPDEPVIPEGLLEHVDAARKVIEQHRTEIGPANGSEHALGVLLAVLVERYVEAWIEEGHGPPPGTEHSGLEELRSLTLREISENIRQVAADRLGVSTLI